jgi:hypothetical protein
MEPYEVSAHILALEQRVVALLTHLDRVRRVGRLRPGTPTHAARLAEIDHLKADLHRALVELEAAHKADRRGVADAVGPPPD